VPVRQRKEIQEVLPSWPELTNGELSAAIELRRLFPGITDNAKARLHARTIAGWMPLPVRIRPVTRLHRRKER
jgi:hypothetical protein